VAATLYRGGDTHMAKAMDRESSGKKDRKKPAKSLKEKRADKKAKKEAKKSSI
jgi:hypothetical protein